MTSKMMLTRIISGGQTGADQAGLAAGLALGLRTGGLMPLDWLTETGPAPAMAKKYNMAEHSTSSYIKRTRANIMDADATVIFGNIQSPGSLQTRNLCRSMGFPYYHAPWDTHHKTNPKYDPLFLLFLDQHQVKTLNVAGNRESVTPGIFTYTYNYLVLNLGHLFGVIP